MKRLYLPLIAVFGFVVGWSLPESDPAPALSSAPPTAEGPRRELRKRALLEQLLFEEEREGYQKRSASIAELVPLLNGMRHGQSCGGYNIHDDIARMVSLDPVAAMDKVLSDPLAEYAGAVAVEWARRQPEEAIRYLRGKKKSYRVEDCLEAIAEAQSKTAEEAPPEPTEASAEPDQTEDTPDPAPATPEPPAESNSWDPANFDPEDYDQREALSEALRKKPDETIARASTEGSPAARQHVMENFSQNFPYDPKEWPEASRKLETAIQQLGVIPEDPPSVFSFGPSGMDGSEVATWIDRQPLALRRAWAPKVVEEWVQADPQAAMAWAASLPEQANPDQAIQTGLIVWTHQDPSAAIAYVEGLPEGDSREVAISNAAATWNCIDPSAAKKWVEELPDSPGKRRALKRLGQ